MSFSDLPPQQFAEQLLDIAAKSGVQAAEVFQSRSLSRAVYFEANRLKQLETIQVEGTTLRIWRGGCPGLAVAYGPVDPQTLVERAIALSHLNPPELIELTSPALEKTYNSGKPVRVEQLVDWGEQAITEIGVVYPDILCTGEWEYEVETISLKNSLGLECHSCDTTLSGYLSAEWIRGDDFLSVADGQTQRERLEPSALAQQVLQRLDWAQENASSPSRRVPVLFTAKAADMLWSTIQAALSGKQVLERTSPWSDRLGEQVTAQALTLSQQPNQGPFSRPFDDEGTPTRPVQFIQDGVLQLFYTDRATGRLLSSGTTGNGFRPDLNSYPAPGLFNFLVEPGSQSLKHLIASLDDGLIVDQMLGGSGGISGDFSVNVDLGFRVHKGEIVGRVKDTMVSGNVYTALRQLVALGNDADWNGWCYTPSLIVEGLSTIGRE